MKSVVSIVTRGFSTRELTLAMYTHSSSTSECPIQPALGLVFRIMYIIILLGHLQSSVMHDMLICFVCQCMVCASVTWCSIMLKIECICSTHTCYTSKHTSCPRTDALPYIQVSKDTYMSFTYQLIIQAHTMHDPNTLISTYTCTLKSLLDVCGMKL